MRTLGFRNVNPFSQLIMWAYGLIKYRRIVWNPGILRSYKEAAELGLIEPRIAELVSCLNVDGVVSTEGCCEGHRYDDGTFDPPGVSIKAEIAFASNLNRMLLEASPTAEGRLHYHWIIEYGWFLSLRPYMPSTMLASDFDREKIDQDFATIAHIVKTLIVEARRSGAR